MIRNLGYLASEDDICSSAKTVVLSIYLQSGRFCGIGGIYWILRGGGTDLTTIPNVESISGIRQLRIMQVSVESRILPNTKQQLDREQMGQAYTFHKITELILSEVHYVKNCCQVLKSPEF